jgi:hypothetical protein
VFIPGLGNVPPLVVVDDSHGYVCRTTFSAPELLDPAKRPADPEQRARVLADGLVFLSACQARIELRIGHGIKRLMGPELGGPRKLGIPRAVDACQAVCGFSWSFGRQLRRMHERLEELRFLRAAFNSGRVPRTKIRAVLAVATRETDGAWAQLAKMHSVEWLQAAANATRKSGAMPATEPHPDDAAPETVTLSWMTSVPHALAFTYWGREMLKTVVGAEASDGTLLQALTQELESDAQVPPEDDEPAAGSARPRPGVPAPFARACTLARLRERSRRQHQRDLRDGVAGTRVDLELRRLRIHLPHVTDHGSVGSLAECIKTLACLRRRIEWERSRLLAGLAKDDLWKKLSYPSWPQFLQHALGLSPKDAANLLALEGAVAEMPPLGDALRDGRLSARAVRMVASCGRGGRSSALSPRRAGFVIGRHANSSPALLAPSI